MSSRLREMTHSIATPRVRTGVEFAAHAITHPWQYRDLIWWIKNHKETTTSTRLPWWPLSAIQYVKRRLAPGANVFEYGAGGSTLWLIDQATTVVSIEHVKDWCETLQPLLDGKAELRFIPPTDEGRITGENETGYFDSYVASITSFPSDSFDLVVVDGRARVECCRAAKSRIRPGGMLLLDDSDRHKYRTVHDEFSNWKARTLAGPKIGKVRTETTIWTKPMSSK